MANITSSPPSLAHIANGIPSGPLFPLIELPDRPWMLRRTRQETDGTSLA